MGRAPDRPMVELAAALAEGTRHVSAAFAALGDSGGLRATARRRRRAREPAPGRAHLPGGDVGSRSGSTTRTRSRPGASSTAGWPRASEALKDVAERVWYSVLKES